MSSQKTTSQHLASAARKLHSYVTDRHWTGEALVGPDPGIRLNYRIGRFVKSYLRFLPWKDKLAYLQAQGYWVLGNWALFNKTGEDEYRRIAVACSRFMLDHQREDGAWDYPNREWKGRVATAEGTWGSMGLVETYRQTGETEYLNGALDWHKYLIDTVGFRQRGDELAVNYFANRGRGRVPNNSAIVLRFLADLADVTQDSSYLQQCGGLLTFLENVQRDTGEFPYVVNSTGTEGRWHFQCFQYNAFMCLDLMRYFELRGCTELPALVLKLLDFLRGGLDDRGFAYYECGRQYRTVTYHTAVLAAAFSEGTRHGAVGFETLAERASQYILSSQRRDGSFPYSRGDYRVLSDRRSYPRYLAMILLHLLTQDGAVMRVTEKERAGAPAPR